MMTLTSPPTTPTNLIGPGCFVLIVGPSSAGKDTLIAGARTVCADATNVAFPRRVVTRAISDAEDHDSLDVADFDRTVKDGKFALWWEATATNIEYQVQYNVAIRAGSCRHQCIAGNRFRRASTLCARRDGSGERTAGRVDVASYSRLRQTDGSLAEPVKRNNLFVDFRTDHMIETTGTPDTALQRLLEVIIGVINACTNRRTGPQGIF